MARFGETIKGLAWKFGNSVDTNQLAPGGLRDTEESLKANCLKMLRPEFPNEVRPGDIIVAGTNFGNGSARQTAIQVLQLLGVQAVVAESIARTYLRNSITAALPVFVAPGVSGIVEDREPVEIDYVSGVVRNTASGAAVPFKPYPASVERIYEAGGLFQVIRERLTREGFPPVESGTS